MEGGFELNLLIPELSALFVRRDNPNCLFETSLPMIKRFLMHVSFLQSMEGGVIGLIGLMLAVHLSRRDTGAALSHDLHVEVSSATDSPQKRDMYRVSSL